jgi:F-type H+-transporting ATPase subunit c
VNRRAKWLLLVFGLLVFMASPVFAQPGQAPTAQNVAEGVAAAFSGIFSRYFGVAFTVIGAAYGISKLGSSAYESMSRQPEVAGNIQTAMIIAAALIEGFTFFALLVCMLV